MRIVSQLIVFYDLYFSVQLDNQNDIFGLTYDSKLYIEFENSIEMYPHKSFCVAYDNVNEQNIQVCLPPDIKKASVQELYLACKYVLFLEES